MVDKPTPPKGRGKSFSDFVEDAMNKGMAARYGRESLKWIAKNNKGFKLNPSQAIRNEAASLTQKVGIGVCAMFFYDPKTKDKLPYYDRFPCVFVIELYRDGFLAINLHYLHPLLRAKLMDELYGLETSSKVPNNKKLKISYEILARYARYKYFRPCIKRYLFSHVKSRFLKVPYEHWNFAVMLPLQTFEKATATKVWSESSRKLNTPDTRRSRNNRK